MNQLKFAIPFILTAIIFFNSCKKYEEGPFISFRSAKHRIDGNWMIESFTANGADSMSYIFRYHLQGQWRFGRDDGLTYPSLGITTDSNKYTGEWESSSPHTGIALNIMYFTNTNNVTVNTNTFPSDWVLHNYWQIIKLKKDNMKLKFSKGGIEYEISFKPY